MNWGSSGLIVLGHVLRTWVGAMCILCLVEWADLGPTLLYMIPYYSAELTCYSRHFAEWVWARTAMNIPVGGLFCYCPWAVLRSFCTVSFLLCLLFTRASFLCSIVKCFLVGCNFFKNVIALTLIIWFSKQDTICQSGRWYANRLGIGSFHITENR